MQPAKKPCPECAEEVEVQARRCHHCGATLIAQPGHLGPTPLLQRRVSWVAWIAIFVGFPAAVSSWLTFASGAFPKAASLLALGVFLFLLLAGVVLFTRDVGRSEHDKAVGGHLPVLGGCVGLPTVWIVCWFVLFMLFRPPDPRMSTETQAIGALKTIGAAQALFREADKDEDGFEDYGTLQELASAGAAGLIDQALGSGTKSGYLYECTYGSSTSEFIWFATARPALPTTTGDRYFVANHEGVVYYTTTRAFSLDSVTCEISDHAIPVGGMGKNRGQLRAEEQGRGN